MRPINMMFSLVMLLLGTDAVAQQAPIRMPSPGGATTTPRLSRADYRAARRVALDRARQAYSGLEVRLSRGPLHRGTTGQGGDELLWGVSVRQPGQRGWIRKTEAVGAKREPNLAIPEHGYYTRWQPSGVMKVVDVMQVPLGTQERQLPGSSREGMVVRTRGMNAIGELYAIEAGQNLNRSSEGTKRSRRFTTIRSAVLTPDWSGAARTPVPSNSMWREKVDTSASVSVHQIFWAQGNRRATANGNGGEPAIPFPNPIGPPERKVTLKQQFNRTVPFPPRPAR